MSSEQSGSRPIVAVTRTCPGPVDLPIAEVRCHGDGRADRASLLRLVAGARAIISMFHDVIDAGVLDAAGPGLGVVVNHAVGYDNIDLEACRARGVAVCNTPDAVTEGTANLAMLLILACARRVVEGDRFVRSGAWASHGPLGMHERLGLELAGRTLLLVGAGRIAYATALRASAFGMRALYVSRGRRVAFECSPLAGERVGLEEGLSRADVVSLHTPLTSETRHLIGARELGLMRAEAILVNTARGPVVDEAALASALAAGRLWGAGLDVFEDEPRVHPGLVASDRVVLSPHVGSAERRFRAIMTELAVESVRAVLEGREPARRIA